MPIEGSSPRVRGIAPIAESRLALLGIIPACAGNRQILDQITGDCRDHPRVCGE